MTRHMTDKLPDLEINNYFNGKCSMESYYPIEIYLEIEEVRSIFSKLMALQSDKSEESQCRCAIIANVTHHRHSRSRHHGSCYNACEPLKTAARLAYEYRLEDPVLEEMFRALYECNGSFAEIFYNKRFEKEGTNADVEYFLEQATRMKLLFPVQNEKKPMLECPLNRMYSTFRPIEGAIDNERFDNLELMVRYGACLDYETAFGDPISVAQMALDLVFRYYDAKRDRFKDKPKLPAYLGFLRLVLRAVPRVTYPTTQRFRNESMFAVDQAIVADKHSMFDKLQREGVVSRGSAGSEPQKLKHLAKIVVRSALYSAWALPSGIGKLGLPKSLMDYVDLKTD